MQEAANQQLVVLQKQHPNQPNLQFDLCMFLQFSWSAMLEHRRSHRRSRRVAQAEVEGVVEEEEDIERECKAEDDADVELFRRMEEQKQVPRPLVIKAKCSPASSGSPLQALVSSCSAQYATDAEMLRAQQDNKVRASSSPVVRPLYNTCR